MLLSSLGTSKILLVYNLSGQVSSVVSHQCQHYMREFGVGGAVVSKFGLFTEQVNKNVH